MYLKVTYEQEFDDLMMYLRSKYPAKLFDLDGIGEQVDMSKFSKKFFSANTTADASIDANANVDDISVIAYNTELPKPFFKLNSYYILWKELRRLYGQLIANEIIERQLTGDIYIHDFHGIAAGQPYCYNYSTYDIMTQGLPMVKKIKSKPPKYLYAFKSQLEQFTVIASNSTLGATGLADMLIIMSYYVKNIIDTGADAHFELINLDLALSFTEEQKLVYNSNMKEIKEKIINGLNQKQQKIYQEHGFYSSELFESFSRKQYKLYYQARGEMVKKIKESFSTEQNEMYAINIFNYIRENLVSFIYTINQPMRANQSPFTNISVYDRFFLEKLCGDYIFPDGTTPDIELVEKLQDLFLTIMNNEMERTPITFPITTACFSIDENNKLKDKEFLRFIAKHNKRYGFINLYGGDSSTLSSCCRLRSETKSEYFNSFGSGSSKIGSLGVCSINFPRLAINAEKDETSFFEELKKLIEICAKVNNAKRHIVRRRIENGNLPLYTMGFCELSTQYSTVGVNGLNECVEFMGKDILTEEGQRFTLDVINTINVINKRFEKQYNAPHNCEQVPGENMSIKMAEKDKLLGYQNVHNIYSNQFIPLITNADMLDRIMLQAKFDKQFSGGAICHINVDTLIEDETQLEKLIETVIEMGVVYFAINYNLQECAQGHMNVGKGTVCSICGGEIVNNYTRVVGFLTNTRNWHRIRRNEDYPHRQFYNDISIGD
jgi:anaerobic ribonucleoside-triphosphate reductase